MGTVSENEVEGYILEQEQTDGSSTIYERVAVASGLLPAMIGLLSLVGWGLGLPLLASLHPNFIPMAPSTALAFLLLGTTLTVRVRVPTNRFGKAYGLFAVGMVFLVSVLILVEFLAQVPSGIEQFLLKSPGLFDGVRLGRMSPITALGFLLASSALFLLLRSSAPQHRVRAHAAILALLSLLLMVVVLAGYLYGTPLLYGATIIPVALPTAIAFLFLGAGLLAHAGPLTFPLRPFVGSSSQARLLPASPVVLSVASSPQRSTSIRPSWEPYRSWSPRWS